MEVVSMGTAIDRARRAKQALRERPSVLLRCREGVCGGVEVWTAKPEAWCRHGRLVVVTERG